MTRIVFALLRELKGIFITYVPGRLGSLFRVLLTRLTVRWLGRNIFLDTGVEIAGGSNIEIGSNITVHRFSTLSARRGRLKLGSRISINAHTSIEADDGGTIEIGDNVLIAQNVVIRAADHRHDRADVPIIEQGHVGARSSSRMGLGFASTSSLPATSG